MFVSLLLLACPHVKLFRWTQSRPKAPSTLATVETFRNGDFTLKAQSSDVSRAHCMLHLTEKFEKARITGEEDSVREITLLS